MACLRSSWPLSAAGYSIRFQIANAAKIVTQNLSHLASGNAFPPEGETGGREREQGYRKRRRATPADRRYVMWRMAPLEKMGTRP